MNRRALSTEEQRLAFFLGTWSNSGQVSPGPFGPGGSVTGETIYHWDVGGRWLLYTSRLNLPQMGAYEVHGGVAYDSQAAKYAAFAVNSLDNLLVYDGEWTDDVTLVFTLVHPPPVGRARVIYRKLPNGSFTMTSGGRQKLELMRAGLADKSPPRPDPLHQF